jgi:cytochrome c peroxidase
VPNWNCVIGVALAAMVALGACRGTGANTPSWERDNPLKPVPAAPLGVPVDLARLPNAPTPARIRLGRWLFFDRRLSADGAISCATCHQPQYAFSGRTPVAVGIGGHTGRRKVLPIINLALQTRPTLFRNGPEPPFFWDGRAPSLERQALQPVVNPDEMGSTESAMIRTLSGIRGYRASFNDAFGDGRITPTRVAQAIADYERTRMSGNSPFDRWKAGDPVAISEAAKLGASLFEGKAQCAHCHGGNSLSGGGFHNTGVGWDPRTRTFADPGHYLPTQGTVFEDWPGTFKAPTLREVSRHPPYMHDGSIATLREVVKFYNRGARPNPYLDGFIHPLGLTARENDALVALINTLNGEGWQDDGPSQFPQ